MWPFCLVLTCCSEEQDDITSHQFSHNPIFGQETKRNLEIPPKPTVLELTAMVSQAQAPMSLVDGLSSQLTPWNCEFH